MLTYASYDCPSRLCDYIVPMNSQPKSVQLPRILGPWMAIAIVIGTVIGSGVFKKASSVSEHIPNFGLVMAAWVFVGVLVLLGALALAEVAILIPKAGGNYAFLSESFGAVPASYLGGLSSG